MTANIFATVEKLREVSREKPKPKSTLRLDGTATMEELLVHPDGFGLSTATPLQLAICRIADGRKLGELAKHEHVLQYIGDATHLAGQRPTECYIVCAIRSGKTKLAAARAITAALTCDLSPVGTGEIPRVPIVSTSKDNAIAAYQMIKEYMLTKPVLKSILVEEPGESPESPILIRHPSGKPIEIRIKAGSKAGSTLVSRWLAGVIFDEAARMNGQEDGVINLDDARKAVIGRLLPGAQIFYPGSPWAPFGPVYNAVQEHWLRPSRSVVVVKAPGWTMNPYWWTEERAAQLKIDDPAAYKTDVEAEFADQEYSMFTCELLDGATRQAGDIPRQHGHYYVAAMDPATRGNGWSFGIATKTHGGMRKMVLAKQWIGKPSYPLSPRDVLKEIAAICKQYDVYMVFTDQWSADSLRDLAFDQGIALSDIAATAQDKVNWFDNIKGWCRDQLLELHPAVVDDMKRVKRKTTFTGVSIVMPKTSDGRHCDYAAMTGLLLSRPLLDPDIGAMIDRYTPEGQALLMEQQELEAWKSAQNEERYKL